MSDPIRVGWGFDAHRFGPDGPVVLCGVEVDHDRGVEATSDGDLAAHALIDALFGASALGDLGTHFGIDDPEMEDADSMAMLGRAAAIVEDQGFRIGSVDLTIISESVRVAQHREAMRNGLARTLGVDSREVSIKATSTDGMGWIGNDEGIAVAAVAVIYG